MGTVVDSIITVPNVVMMIAVSGLLVAVRKAAKGVWQHPIVARIDPLLPLALCVAGMFIPQVGRESLLVGDKIMIGLALGSFAMAVYKIVKQSILKQDERIARAAR